MRVHFSLHAGRGPRVPARSQGIHLSPKRPLNLATVLNEARRPADWSIDERQRSRAHTGHEAHAALARWNREPAGMLLPWLGLSVLISAALLLTVYSVALLSAPDLTVFAIPGYNVQAGFEDYLLVLYRNSLVLALHALACVAGFIAAARCRLPRSTAVARRAGCTRRPGRSRSASSSARPSSPSPLRRTSSEAPRPRSQGSSVSRPARCCWRSCRTRCQSWSRSSSHWRPGCWRAAGANGRSPGRDLVTVAIAVPLLLAAAAIEIWASPHFLHAIAS